MKIKIFIDLVARVALILLALVIVGYLLFSNEADGDRVNIHERWFEYGEPSFPVQDSESKLAVGYSLLSPRELDENENPFYWITESGDVLAITNLTGVKRDVIVTLNFFPNPCKNSRQIIIGTEYESIQVSVPPEGKVSHALSFVLDEGKTKFFLITPLPGKICNIGDSDFRNFITLLSNIKIKSNAV